MYIITPTMKFLCTFVRNIGCLYEGILGFLYGRTPRAPQLANVIPKKNLQTCKDLNTSQELETKAITLNLEKEQTFELFIDIKKKTIKMIWMEKYDFEIIFQNIPDKIVPFVGCKPYMSLEIEEF